MCNQAHEVQDLFAHLEQVFGIVLRHHRLEHLRQRHGASSASIAGQSGEHRRSIRSITGQSGASQVNQEHHEPGGKHASAPSPPTRAPVLPCMLYGRSLCSTAGTRMQL